MWYYYYSISGIIKYMWYYCIICSFITAVDAVLLLQYCLLVSTCESSLFGSFTLNSIKIFPTFYKRKCESGKFWFALIFVTK